MNIDLDTDGPCDPRYVLEVAAAFAESVRVLDHLTRHHEALDFPCEADQLIQELSSGTARLPQLFRQIGGWLEQEHAAGRIRVPEGDFAGRPGAAVTVARLRLDGSVPPAENLQGALDAVASVTCDLASAEVPGDGGHGSEPIGLRRRSTALSLAAELPLDRCVTSVLPWLIAAAVLVVLPVLLRLYADDTPRSDDPPDTGEDERDPGPAVLPIAA